MKSHTAASVATICFPAHTFCRKLRGTRHCISHSPGVTGTGAFLGVLR